MGFQLTAADYAEYLSRAYAYMKERGEYITGLDSITGDGDHWANMDMGFDKLVQDKEKLAAMSVGDEFKNIGRTMMTVIGGSSGILYGSAYLAASKVLSGKEVIAEEDLGDVLTAMLEAMMNRGKGKEGDKTMLDCLAPACKEYKKCLEEGVGGKALCARVKQAALDGAENTKAMEAVRGRASYQANKGVGHLDPGAVTMSYQLSVLMDYAAEKAEN